MRNRNIASRIEELVQKSAFLNLAIGRILTQLDSVVPDEQTALGGQLLLYELQTELESLAKQINSESGGSVISSDIPE